MTKSPQRLLVLRACAIGDFVLNLPALRALAASRPSASFTLVGYPQTLALARSFLPIDAIHSIESPPWSGLFAGPAAIPPFDAAFVWMNDGTVAENLRHSGIRDVVHAAPFPSSGHAADHLLRTIDLPAPELPDLWDATSERIVLHPGSGSSSKVWPHFQDLARLLPHATILLGPCESMPEDVRNSRLENLSLVEVADHLRHTRLFIGNDSGITHIAAYWGTPTVALFGATDPRVWGPVGRRVRILEKPSLADISVDDVRKLI